MTENIQIKFSKKNVKVDKQQHDIITQPQTKDICIISCAGSGKTQTITSRVCYMIEYYGCDPESFMITTFTRNASEDMKNRIEQFIGVSRVLCGTFHSISLMTLNKYTPFVLDENIHIDETQYLFYDFLKSEESMEFKEKIKYIFVDEYQDINDIQHKIINEMYKNAISLVVVGDDSQNIYNFRGSNISFILNFSDNFKNASMNKLTTNYRSSKEIINLANAIIKKNDNQIKKDMIPFKKEDTTKPKIYLFDTLFDEIKFVTKSIIDDLTIRRIPPDRIAIFSRNNQPLYYAEEYLTKKGVKNIFISTDYKIGVNYLKHHVTLSSIHSAKGVEWKKVYIIGMNDNFFPSRKDQESIDEERRLFYVAVTRCKKDLVITHSKTQPITRFITELDSSLFDCDCISKSTKSSNRIFNINNSVTHLIKKLNGDDYSKLKKEGIIPQLNFVTTNLYEPYKYPEFVIDLNLYTDFGCFIDYLIRRMLAPISVNESGYLDNRATMMIIGVYLENSYRKTYEEYEQVISYILDLVTDKKITKKHIIEAFKKYKYNIETISEKDITFVLHIINLIIDKAKLFKMKPSKIPIIQKMYIPFEFTTTMVKSYLKYINKNIDWKDIIADVYQVSKCHPISFDRRKNLYVELDPTNLTNCMEWYTDVYDAVMKYFSKDVKCNPSFYNGFIAGDADIITEDNIVDFKNSVVKNLNMEHIVQLLVYTQLARENEMKINKITIFNPLLGVMHTAYVTNWNRGEELVKYLHDKMTIE